MVKSIHIYHFPFSFFTTTILDNHVGNCTSLIKLISFNLSISFVMAFYLSRPNILFFCTILLTLRSMFNLWTTTLRFSSGMSMGDNENSPQFSLSSSVIYATSVFINFALAKVVLSGPSNSTLTNSFYSSVILFLRLSHSSGVFRIIILGCFMIALATIIHPLLASI